MSCAASLHFESRSQILYRGSSDIPGDILPPTRLATECWVERCIHTKQIASLESHVAHEPLGHAMPIEGE